MKFINDLACPQCQGSFEYQLMFEQDDEECGYLHCKNCLSSTPLVLGFPLFTETTKELPTSQTAQLSELVEQIAPGEGKYEKYIEQKFKRDIFEIYAAFQPFNESTRSIYPLIEAWKKHLQPGDLIVDTWCRTGWSGELLAALFPQQRVLSLWQGNSSVLGYRGFYYWLNSQKRSKNLEIIFSPPNAPFPIRSGSAALVHAYDSLHRNDLPQFADECLRVAEKRGILWFPHVHLANNQPDPFFERGGQYRHGQEYKEYFHQRLEEDGRKPLVLSELSLFQRSNSITLKDEAHTDHYNGLILIAEENWYQQTFNNRVEGKLTAGSRLIPNPLVSVNPLTRTAFLNKQALNENVDYLLERHPVYDRLINSKLPMELTAAQLALIAVAESGSDLQECTSLLRCSLDEVIATAQSLASNEIVAALPISEEALALHQFHANNHKLFPDDFLVCWQQLLDRSPDSSFMLVEDEPLTVEQVSRVLMALVQYFQQCENAATGKLVVVGEMNAERLMALMTGWACGFTAHHCDGRNVPATATLVVSDQGIPGTWQNITLESDSGAFIDFWTIVGEFADTEDPLPARSGKPSVLIESGRELPWYLVSTDLTRGLADHKELIP